MHVFILYRNEADRRLLKPLLDRTMCGHGTDLPAQSAKALTIVQWGIHSNKRTANNGHLIVRDWMNSNEALSKLRDESTTERMLTCHGVSWQPNRADERNSSSAAQHYRLFVFNLQPIAMYKGIAQLDIDFRQRSQRQLIREAMRAVYVLGLDFAEVELQLRKNKWAVLSINPTPFVTEHTGKAWAHALDSLMEEPELSVARKTDRLRIGSDSEFILRNPDDGKVVMADRFFSKKGVVGCDGLRLSGSSIIFPFVELRPQPVSGAESAVRAVQAVRQTMQLAARKIGDRSLEWLAGGMPVKGLGIGGHLHFSGLPLRANVLRVLDNYLALPMMMIETESDGQRRPRFGYVGDFRTKDHGGFEYRTLPSWLVSVQITYAVFALAHFLVVHGDALQERPLSQPELLEAFYRGHKSELLLSVQNNWHELGQLSTFIPYAQAIKPLIEQSVAMTPWPQERDFRISWRVNIPEQKRTIRQ